VLTSIPEPDALSAPAGSILTSKFSPDEVIVDESVLIHLPLIFDIKFSNMNINSISIYPKVSLFVEDFY
jgi:hypothetical protein